MAHTHRSQGRDPANARARDTTVNALIWSYLKTGGVQGANARPADDTVAVASAQTRLHARHAFVRHALHEADVEADPARTRCVGE